MFTPRRPDVSSSNRFVWCRRWVLGKQTIESLSEASGYSERQLRRWFSAYLENVPEWTIPRHKGLHLLIDGTWLPDGRCIIVYRDYDRKSILYYHFGDDENEYEIASDLIMLRELGVTISSFTTDGSENIIRAIRYTHPHPRTSAGITLRRIVRMINRIHTNNDRIFWLRELDSWHEVYRTYSSSSAVRRSHSVSVTYWFCPPHQLKMSTLPLFTVWPG